jgi:uncharacterized membrane protein
MIRRSKKHALGTTGQTIPSRRRQWYRPYLESLEDRVLLDAGLPPALVVGRTLSSYTTGGILNNQETITYTVYNEQANPLSGVLLTDTLEPGVTFESASQLPDQSGQKLAWSLGSIQGFDRASITLTVSLANPVPLQLDTGAQAFAMLDGGAVSNSTPAATLRQGSVDPSLLASTPDANTTDPFVQEAAAKLNYDPQQIFNFLHNDIGYNSYAGSLRGARGTLWSSAGNALDVASLGVALMRASGIPARYAHGTLADGLARRLILSMFPNPYRVVGLIDPGTPLSDPANDPMLMAEARDHYWFELDAGGGFQSADPTVAGARIGDAFAAADGTFTEVADAQRQKVTIRLRRELTTPAAGLLTGGAAQDLKTVLEATFNTVELVGKPVTIGHIVDSRSFSTVFPTVTNTYTPYLALGDYDAEPSTADVVQGQSYQEVLTSFPFGSQILTGVFLEIDLTGPGLQPESFERTLADRIGFAARQNGVGAALTADPSGLPLLGPLDVFTLHVLPGLNSPSLPDRLPGVLSTIASGFAELPNQDPPSQATLFQYAALSQRALTAATRAIGAAFLSASDVGTAQLQSNALVKAYFDRPRLILVSQQLEPNSSSQAPEVTYSIDLRRDMVRVIAFPGQSLSATQAFNFTRGVSEGVLERDTLSSFFPDKPRPVRVSTADVFAAAFEQGIPFDSLDADNLFRLDSFDISAEAKARISQAVGAGKTVVVPTSAVQLEGRRVVAWYEIDPATGETIAVGENGSHISAESAGVIGQAIFYSIILLALAGLFSVANTGGFGPIAKSATEVFTKKVPALWKGALQSIANSINGFAHLQGQRTNNRDLINYNLKVDPPVGDQLFGTPPSMAFAGLEPGAGASLAAAIIADPVFTMPFRGAQLPTVFRVGVRNEGPADTFDIRVTDVPAGFTAQTSVSQITIPHGQTAEFSVGLRPFGQLPVPGTTGSFTVEIMKAAAPAVAVAATASFTIPPVHGVTLTADPTGITTIPGHEADLTFTATAVGNVPENVNFTAALSPGMTLAGLTNVSLNPGRSSAQTLRFTPAIGTPLSSTLQATITANFNGSEPVTITIPVRVAVPGADAIANAATAAQNLGNSNLANRLNDLSIALTNLVQTPTSAVFKSQALASLQSILSLLAADTILSTFVPPLSAARDTLASAQGQTQVQAAVVGLGAVLNNFGDAVVALQHHNVTVSLSPNSQPAQPGVPRNFGVVLHNTGDQTTTYNLSLLGLPANVTGSFNQTSITLNPGQFSSGLVATLTETSTDELAAFTFQVQAAAGFPQVVQTASGSLQTRREFVSVASVTPSPPFANPGTSVTVSAKLLNAVNRTQDALVSFVVKNAAGQQVFASTPVAVQLTLLNSLVDANLGAIDTTGFALGQYTITVTVTDTAGNPLPGATGSAALLIGSPVTASLTVSPQLLPPGTSTVTDTLQINSAVNVGDPLSVIAHLPIASFKQPSNPTANDVLESLALNPANGLLYVFGDNGLHVVNDASPSNPTYVRGEAVQGYTNGIVNGNGLITVGPGPVTNIEIFKNSIFDYLALSAPFGTPDNPGELQNDFLPYQFAGQAILVGNHLFVPVLQVDYDQPDSTTSHNITLQTGTVLSILVDPNQAYHPSVFQLKDELFNSLGTTQHLGDGNGGPVHIFSLALANPQTLYAASSTATGSDTQNGVGRLLVVDISDPDHINSDAPSASKIVATLDIPGTVQLHGVAIDGNLAFVVGSQGGWRSPFTDLGDIGPTGNLVLATVDISDPRHPRLIASQVIPRSARGGGDNLIGLGNHRFAFSSLGAVGDTPQLFVVDATDPAHLSIVKQIDVPGAIRGLKTDGNYLYATGDDGLTVYQLGGVGQIPVTAQVQVPKGTGVQTVAGSFNVAPTVIPGTNFDTLQWSFTLDGSSPNKTFTWQTQVTSLQPGETRPVDLQTAVAFTSQGTSGQLQLPAQDVYAKQVLGLDPATQTVQPGAAATYTLTISNPAASAVTYALLIQGVPASWVQLPAQATVPGGGSLTVPVTLTADPFAPATSYNFVVSANVGGTTGSVQGTLTLAGVPVVPAADPDAHGVVVGLSPTQAAAGQGTSAVYTVQLTNTGSAYDTFALTVSGLPAGVTASFAQTSVEVPPGASNFRDVTLLLTPQPGTAIGSVPFTVTATSASKPSVTGTASGTLNVLANGVRVALNPPSGPPGSTFQMTVTNTGQVTDTFALSLASPAGLVSTLGTSKVTLAPGASQVVPITTSAVNFAVPGPLSLTALATSEGNSAVQASASAALSIPQTTGMTASFSPATQVLAVPGSSSFLLQVNNTGNTEDAYTATITGTNGPVSATLTGLDGQPTQTIATFRLPGLSSGAILLNTNLATTGQGAVTVQVQSQSTGAMTSATATVSSGVSPTPPPPTPTPTPTPSPSNPTPVHRTWLEQVYDDLFHRGVDSSGLATWTGFLNQGLSRTQVAMLIEISPPGHENYTDEVQALYQTLLHRAADPVGLGNSVAFLVAGGTVEQLGAFIAGSAEYAARNGSSNDGFLGGLYRDVFHRAVDASGRTTWDRAMAKGMTRAQVAAAIFRSDEYRTDLVQSYYQTYLHRAADAGGFSAFLAALRRGRRDEEVLAVIFGSPEYLANVL